MSESADVVQEPDDGVAPLVDAPAEVVKHEISGRSIWQVIGAVLLTLLGLTVLYRARDLVAMLIISMFFALALIPLVERIHARRGWKRGAAVGLVYGMGALLFIVMVVFLIPLIVELAQRIGANLDVWIADLNGWLDDTFGFNLSSSDEAATAAAGAEAAAGVEEWAKQALGGLLGALSSGIGLVFSAMTIALFTFYFAADHIRIQRLTLSMFSPATQERLGWTWDKAVEQTGGYFYSRVILMGINALGFFFTLVLVGMPVTVSLPLAIIAAFISVFIPAVGTYIGGAIPVMLTLAFQGVVPAVIVLGYVLIYQQLENYWLSPKLSAKTMELNGGVSFGAAIAGGAIAGPMGAFMALPIAALITSFLSHYRTAHEVTYKSMYEGDDFETAYEADEQDDTLNDEPDSEEGP